MHQRPTYETIVKDTILEPRDKIALPNRQATLLRNTQQLSMWDDSDFIDLDEEQKRIMKEQLQQAEARRLTALTATGTHHISTASMHTPPPIFHPPPIKRSASTAAFYTPTSTPRIFRPPTPPGYHPAASSSAAAEPSAAAAAGTSLFDLTLDRDLHETRKRVEEAIDRLAEQDRQKRSKAFMQVETGLQSAAAESFVSQYVQPRPRPPHSRSPPPKLKPKPKLIEPMEDESSQKREGTARIREGSKKSKTTHTLPIAAPDIPQEPPKAKAKGRARSSSVPKQKTPSPPRAKSKQSPPSWPQPPKASAASSSAAQPTTSASSKARAKPYQKNPEESHPKPRARAKSQLPKPSRANLQIIRDALSNAANKDTLSKEDAASVRQLEMDLKPGSKANRKRTNDELRSLYKKYYESFT